MALKLGRLAPKPHLKTLLLSRYLLPDLPPAPEKVYREYKVPADTWGMYGNDSIGDCTCASKAHTMMMMTAHTGKMFVPDPADIIAAYSAISGYDPATGANDNGCAMTDVLAYWQTTGIAGHKILAWAAVDPSNVDMIHQAIYIFGAVDVGVNLPQSAMDQFQAGQPWDVVADDGGILGGHDVPYYGYGSEGETCVTWAKTQQSGRPWGAKYIEEAYVVITEDWLNQADGLAPNSLNLDALKQDLKVVAA
jgi:hypothetical protein